MSLLTRCPACTTAYKVVPDQLRISQGWVKCGQCGDIFDATQHLIQVPIEDKEATAEPEQQSLVVLLKDATESASEPIITSELLGSGGISHVFNEHESENSPESVDKSTPETSSKVNTEPQAETPLLPELTAPECVLRMTDNFSQVSFLQESPQAPIWQHTAVRTCLLMLVFLLFAALGLQWAYQERSRLVTIYPDWRFAIQNLCDAVGCTIAPLRQIESITIESATFSKIDANRYRLSMAIKNVSSLSLALPSVELTLTDLPD